MNNPNVNISPSSNKERRVLKEADSSIAVGLDIGTTKIVAMVGKRSESGKLEILGVGRSKSLGVHRGVVNNITQTINSIQEAISKVEADSGYKIKEVTVGIAGQHIRSLQHSDYITRSNFEEVIDSSDIKALIDQVHNLVMLPGEEIIHVLPQEYKVDSQSEINEPIGMYGSRLEANFHVVVGQVTSIKNIARCVKSAGLNLAGITLEPIASSLASLNMEEKEAGVALVDIGGGTTDIAIFKDNIIRHTSVIPFGGNVITDDIKTGCSIIERHAEQLKVRFGSAWPGENKQSEIVAITGLRGREPKQITLKKLSQIIHARVYEILEQVYVELKHYGCEDQNKKLIAGIVLTGGGSKMKHIQQLTEYITGMDVRIGYSNEHIANGQIEEVANPEYATAVGLVMEGLQKGEQRKNTKKSSHVIIEENKYNKLAVQDVEPKRTADVEKPIAELKPKPKLVTSDQKQGTEEKKSKKDLSPKPSMITKWTDKFIKMINETE